MIYLLCGLQDEAKVFKAEGMTVLCGSEQRDNLANLVKTDCQGLVSAGCAGALDPAIRIGQLFVASSVVLLDGTVLEPDAHWANSIKVRTGAEDATVFSCPTEQCATPEDKANIRTKLGADIVDEESYAVATLATARHLPWLVLRSISDLASQSVLPHDTQAQKPNGSTDITPILGDVFQDPAEAFREAEGFSKSLDVLRKAFRVLGPSFAL